MMEAPVPPVEKTAEQLRADFLAVYEQAEKIREKLNAIIRELGDHGFIFAEQDPSTTNTVDR